MLSFVHASNNVGLAFLLCVISWKIWRRIGKNYQSRPGIWVSVFYFSTWRSFFCRLCEYIPSNCFSSLWPWYHEFTRRNISSADKSHNFIVEIGSCSHKVYATSRLLKSFLVSSVPVNYDLQKYTSIVTLHLLSPWIRFFIMLLTLLCY